MKHSFGIHTLMLKMLARIALLGFVVLLNTSCLRSLYPESDIIKNNPNYMEIKTLPYLSVWLEEHYKSPYEPALKRLKDSLKLYKSYILKDFEDTKRLPEDRKSREEILDNINDAVDINKNWNDSRDDIWTSDLKLHPFMYHKLDCAKSTFNLYFVENLKDKEHVRAAKHAFYIAYLDDLERLIQQQINFK